MSSPVPVNSKQLHNFSLPPLKWNKNNNLNQRRRHAAESSPHRQGSPVRDLDSNHRKDDHVEKTEKVSESEKDSKAKIFIRLRKSGKVAKSADEENESRDQVSEKDEIQVEKGGDVENCENEEVEEPKTWNLRPRRAGKKVMNADIKGTIKIQEHRTRVRTDVIGNSSGVGEKEKKQKFSVSLSREEIEEDFLILTGSKLPRKLKKRTKTVQKQLDSVFPGLWLSSVTPGSYKVPDPKIKYNPYYAILECGVDVVIEQNEDLGYLYLYTVQRTQMKRGVVLVVLPEGRVFAPVRDEYNDEVIVVSRVHRYSNVIFHACNFDMYVLKSCENSIHAWILAGVCFNQS